MKTENNYAGGIAAIVLAVLLLINCYTVVNEKCWLNRYNNSVIHGDFELKDE